MSPKNIIYLYYSTFLYKCPIILINSLNPIVQELLLALASLTRFCTSSTLTPSIIPKASDLKPIKEFCKNSASWAVPGDIESLVKAIEYYLNNNNKYLDHIKMNNDLINSDYNWNIISNKLLNIYKELLT